MVRNLTGADILECRNDNVSFNSSMHNSHLMQYLDRPGVSFCTRTTYDDNAITNAIEIYDGPR